MGKESSLNLNTILLTVALAALGWLGYQTTEGIKGLASLQTKAENVAKQVEKIESKFTETVSRREYDSRLTAIEASIVAMQIDLNRLNVKTGGKP